MPEIAAHTLFLVRHGETEWNREQRMQGQGDSRLTPKGEEQARAHGRFLSGQNIGKVYASPLGRVQQTSALIGERMPHVAIKDDRLKEWHTGDWSGHLYADLPHRWPEEHDAWQADRYGFRPPSGENYEDLINRAHSFLTEHGKDFAPVTTIVAHGLINRALAAVLLDLSREEILAIRQSNDVIMRLSVKEGEITPDHFVGGYGPRRGLPGVKADTRRPAHLA